MARNGSLLSFFKPQTKSQKRPAQDENVAKAATEQRKRSKSPKVDPKNSKSVLKPRRIHTHPDSHLTPPSNVNNASNISDTSSLTSLSDTEPISSPTASQTAMTTDTLPQQPSAAEDSFISISSIASSQRRTGKDGEEMVIDSDDEDSDDGELLDLDTLLSSKPLAPKTLSTPASLVSPNTNPFSSGRNTRGNKSGLSFKPIPTVPKYKFSLDSLVLKVKKDASHDAEIEEALREAKVSEQTIAALAKKESGGEINTDLLASVIHDEKDPDSIERVMKAIKRTEALQRKKRWRFFTQDASNMSVPQFPKMADSPLATILEKSLERDAAIVSGYLEDFAMRNRLPKHLIAFMLEAAVFEERREFHDAYCSILAHTRQGEAVSGGLTIECICQWLSCLGVPDAALAEDYVVKPEIVEPKKAGQLVEKDWTILRNIIRVLRHLAMFLDPSERSRVLLLLVKVSLDSDVSTDPGTLLLLKDSFAALVDAMTESKAQEELPKFMSHVYKHVRDVQLRLQFLRNIAASSTRVCRLRKLLASAFFYESRQYIQNWPGITPSLSLAREFLSTKTKFNIKGDMDYAWLGAAISMLDIGLDDGNAPRGVDAEAAKLYNAELDKLVFTINTMQAMILDTGANHLTRTEAKEALEVLQSRLEFTVRTKIKPRNSIFGDSDMPNANIKNFFKREVETPDGIYALKRP